MHYMGSKRRIAPFIVSIIAERVGMSGVLHEPFCGGANFTSAWPGPVFATDARCEMIAFWKAIQQGWEPPLMTREDYDFAKANPRHDPKMTAWAAVNGFRSKWFGGFDGKSCAGVIKRGPRAGEYCNRSPSLVMRRTNVLRQAPSLPADRVLFAAGDYSDFDSVSVSCVYCDPPYFGTTGYGQKFDHARFWLWAMIRSSTVPVFVSERFAPAGWQLVWERDTLNRTSTAHNKRKVERLFYRGPEHLHTLQAARGM